MAEGKGDGDVANSSSSDDAKPDPLKQEPFGASEALLGRAISHIGICIIIIGYISIYHIEYIYCILYSI